MTPYELNWTGLDQGVEHTWSREVLLEGLAIIASNAPLEHRDPTNPFYEEMERRFPGKTWRAYDGKDGSFRPVFRRSNTWKKLGLIVEIDKKFSLSLIGRQLLSGELQLSEVFTEIFKTHVEGEEKPFIVLATLLAAVSDEVSVDLILKTLYFWRPQDDLNDAMNKAVSFDAASLVGFATRRRRINSMLKLFVTMGAIEMEKSQIKVIDESLLVKLGEINQLEYAFYEQMEFKIAEKKPSSYLRVAKRRKRGSATNIIKFAKRAADVSDPERRLRLLERASNRHELTVSKLARILNNLGKSSYENVDAYDLYTPITDSLGIVFEIKSITKDNCKKQIREAVSQLYEYSYRFKEELSQTNELVIVLDKSPRGIIEEWVSEYVTKDRGITLAWFDQETFEFESVAGAMIARLFSQK